MTPEQDERYVQAVQEIARAETAKAESLKKGATALEAIAVSLAKRRIDLGDKSIFEAVFGKHT